MKKVRNRDILQPLDGNQVALCRILRRPAVEEATGLARSTLYDLMARGQFPRPIRLTGKAVGWEAATIDEWITSRRNAGK